jgi:hypothetical protein
VSLSLIDCYVATGVVVTRTGSTTGSSGCSTTTSCPYQCAAAYSVTTSGSTATLTPTTTVSGCNCLTLSATVQNAIVGSDSYNDVFAAVPGATANTVNVVAYIAYYDLTCESTYTSSGTCALGSSSGTCTLTRTGSVGGQAGCATTSSCSYQCSASYTVTFTSATPVTVTPGTVTGCTCYSLTGIVTPVMVGTDSMNDLFFAYYSSSTAVSVGAFLPSFPVTCFGTYTVASGSTLPTLTASSTSTGLGSGFGVLTTSAPTASPNKSGSAKQASLNPLICIILVLVNLYAFGR